EELHLELERVGTMQRRHVLRAREVHQLDPVAPRYGREPAQHGLAAGVRLDQDVHRRDAVECIVPRWLPAPRAGDAESRELVMPQRLRVARALDDAHGAGRTRLSKAGETVRNA